MFGPTNGTADRDALRRALHVSLRDVLMDVAADTATVPTSRDALFAAPQSQPLRSLRAGDENPTLQQVMASRHLGGFPQAAAAAAVPQNPAFNMNASMDQQQLLNAAMLNEQRLLQQARNALTKQRLLAEEKKRQMLLEENKQRMIEGSYMAYLRDKMSAKGKPEGQDTTNIPPLALLALQGTRLAQQNSPVLPSMPVAPAPAQKKISNPLEALGSTLRNVDDPYVDVSDIQDKTAVDPAQRKARGGVQIPFPEKLHTMLKEMEAQGKTDIVSFYSHGRAFGVHDPDRFVEEIMPKFFKMGKWNSFARQLNLYGFVRITTGPDAGGYYHELFLKGRPNMCQHMRRVGVPQGTDRRKNKAKSQGTDPDFYSMKPVV